MTPNEGGNFNRLGGMLDLSAMVDTSMSPTKQSVDLPDSDFKCLVCHDAGYVRRVLPLEHPDFGKAFPCHACAPTPVAAGLPEALKDAVFGDFNLSLNPEMRDAYEQCKRVSSGEAWCALLVGPSGLGKSMLAVSVLNAFSYGWFWTLGDLWRRIRQQSYGDNATMSDEDAIRVWSHGEFPLVIDDIGAEVPRDSTAIKSALYTILAGRYEKKLPTILTTNNIDFIDDRTLDRYRVGTVVCRGKSQRPSR